MCIRDSEKVVDGLGRVGPPRWQRGDAGRETKAKEYRNRMARKRSGMDCAPATNSHCDESLWERGRATACAR
eukprot:1188034-Lingulodinium_polyedra.AAC.1